MKCYLRETLNDLKVTTFFPEDFELQSAMVNFQHTHLDLMLTNESNKEKIYSGILLNSYWIRPGAHHGWAPDKA